MQSQSRMVCDGIQRELGTLFPTSCTKKLLTNPTVLLLKLTRTRGGVPHVLTQEQSYTHTYPDREHTQSATQRAATSPHAVLTGATAVQTQASPLDVKARIASNMSACMPGNGLERARLR